MLSGFTLAELLICLTILGEITIFTLPKIISSQQEHQYNAIAKETAAMVSSAYQLYSIKNTVTIDTGVSDLTPYMNYVSLDTSSVIDNKQTQTSNLCSTSGYECLRLHNGAILRYGESSNYHFGGLGPMNAVWFDVDPDGSYSGSTQGNGKAIQFWIYYNGRISTRGTILANTCVNAGCNIQPNPAYDPPWFHW